MSPEQAQSVPDIDGRADLFGVGAIIFEALSGRAPHEGPTYESVLIKICTEDAPDLNSLNADVPPKVAAAVARALARDRDQRFDTAEDFSAALEDALRSEPEPPARARPRWLWLALAGGALALAAVAAWSARAPAEDTEPTPGTTTDEPANTADTPAQAPRDEALEPAVAPATAPAPSVVPSAAPIASPAASKPKPSPRPKPRVTATASPTKRVAPRSTARTPSSKNPSTGVASGLRLNTREP
jgi:serine/threonine-protein kinase